MRKNFYLVWGNLAHVLQLLLESVLTSFICCPPCCSANQRPPPSKAQPMGALPAPPLRRNSCGHLGKLSRHPAPVVSTARACWFGKHPQKTDLSEHISKVAIDPPSSPRASLLNCSERKERICFLSAGVRGGGGGGGGRESMFEDWFASTTLAQASESRTSMLLATPCPKT